MRGVINLDDSWRFQEGDDPRWADPAFDDKDWTSVVLSKPLVEQGAVFHNGYGWYRLRLQPQQIAGLGSAGSRTQLLLLVTSNSVGQLTVYVNGAEAGHTRGMTERPSEYQSPPFVVQVPGDGAAPVTLAIRSWAGPTTATRRGLLEKVEVGTPEDVKDKLAMATSREWNEHAISAMAVTFLFLFVAVLGTALYVAQLHHSEYLWMALLCVSVAAGGTADVIFGLGLISASVFRILTLFTGRVFMAVTVEFVMRFTASKPTRAIRIFQVSVLLLPLVYLLPGSLLYQVLSVSRGDRVLRARHDPAVSRMAAGSR